MYNTIQVDKITITNSLDNTSKREIRSVKAKRKLKKK